MSSVLWATIWLPLTRDKNKNVASLHPRSPPSSISVYTSASSLYDPYKAYWHFKNHLFGTLIHFLLWKTETETDLFLAAAALSLCLRFLNQFPTCVGVSPVACANSLFLLGLGYGSCRYHSLNRLRVRSLKQCVFCSPSQMVRGSGNFFRTRYLSTGPRGRPRSFSASW